MATEQFANAVQTTLNGSLTSGATSMTVTSATGFPSSGNFRCLLSAEGANTNEIVTVTAVSGTTFTISRATEAYAGVTAASAHASGATVTQVLTAGGLAQTITDQIPTFAYANSDNSVSSTGYADDPDLQLAVVASGIYIVDATIIFDTNAASVAILLAVNGPASPTNVAIGVIVPTAAPAVGGNAAYHAWEAAYDSMGATGITSGTGAGGGMALMRGIFENGSNAGTFVIRHASETNTATVIKRGSWLSLRKIG